VLVWLRITLTTFRARITTMPGAAKTPPAKISLFSE